MKKETPIDFTGECENCGFSEKVHIQGKSGCFPEKENGGFERRKGYVKNIFHNKSSVRLEASGTGWILTVKDEFTENALTLTSEELKKLKDILNNKINI